MLSSRVAVLLRTGWGRVVVQILLWLLAVFVCWFAVGMVAGINTGWQWLIVWSLVGVLALVVMIAPFTIVDRTSWYIWCSYALFLLLAVLVSTVPGDWYLRAFGERLTATVVARESNPRTDGYDYRLAGPDGRPLSGLLELDEKHQVQDELLVTVDPLGVLSPRPRAGWSSEFESIVALAGLAGWVVLEIADGVAEERERRRVAAAPSPAPTPTRSPERHKSVKRRRKRKRPRIDSTAARDKSPESS
ncbi:hypothetical protein [Rhizohabitans arisaemae]|uniref:hypothetical protein n=1 Tax=Rhizohabitans arisaemae TaxID=2720610 RepID=UPI0024B1620F|nr:hypothetical protein [Rhizohabitans arisaemae]